MFLDIKNARSKIPFYLLALYFFFLAAYSKKFAYLSISLGPIPIYISELVLFTFLITGFSKIKLGIKNQSRLYFLLIVAFLFYGFMRLVFSVRAGVLSEFGLMPTLKQTCIFYQALWIFVPLLFSKIELKKLYSAILLGIAFAQLIGWLGFLLMGTYSTTVSKLIGFPVGNEAMLPLYLFSVLILSSIYSFPVMASFGLLWITQFILYMKRSWVFSVMVFALPLVLWCIRAEKTKKLKLIVSASAASLLFAFFTVGTVKNRERPVFYHISDSKEAEEQRKQMPAIILPFLSLLDGIYQNTDTFEPNVSMQQIIFKGDLVQGSNILNPSSTMAFRLHFWKQAWEGFKTSPIFGLGFGPHYAETQLNGLPAMFEGKWVSGPHNGFLAILNRMGIIGALLFFPIILVPLIQWFYFGDRDVLSMISIATFLSLNFFVLFNVCLENPQGGVWYWFFLGIILNSIIQKRTSGRKSQ